MNEMNKQAVSAAEIALKGFNSKPTSLLSYQSNGRVLVLGNEQSLNFCKGFTQPLNIIFLLMTGSSKTLDIENVLSLNQRSIDIQGHLGNFKITLTDAQGVTDFIEVDLILDLNTDALIKLEIPPLGYVHESNTDDNQQEIQDRLVDLTGEFEKPKYFNYNAEICAHGVNGKTVCTNCIEACPAGAITSLVEKIKVDAYLCQGGGTCATVCPSGAIQYAYPRLSDSGNQIRLMLKAFRESGGEHAVVLFHAEEELNAELAPNYLPIKVEEIASVGMELCLSTLVYGASQVVLLVNDDVPQLSLKNINQQLDWLQTLLMGLGLKPLMVTLQKHPNEVMPVKDLVSLEPAFYSMPDNKRQALFQALDHLYQQIEKTRELVSLPAGAPFGSASIDENSCTLCMACVGSCPGKALQDGSNREVPEILFIESNCIQCGTCTHTCPEQAISISPRFIFNREKRNQSRVLNQDTPFGCITCGKPFAPTSVIQKMSHQLKDHYMFKTTRALNRLKMCDDCRVADIVQDPEAVNGNIDPLRSASSETLS